MRESDRPDNEQSTRESTHPVKNARQSKLRKEVGVKQGSPAAFHGATGPRTAAGKKRSRFNAVKSGIFSSAALLKHESPAEYQAILDGLREDFKPAGMLESALVETLAILFWRKRRLLLAESAEIATGYRFKALDSVNSQLCEAWDRSRAGETSNGLLRNGSNPVVIRHAIEILKIVRIRFNRFGFRDGEIHSLLKKVYGLDHDGKAPLGMYRDFESYSKLAAADPEGVNTPYSPDELKKEMLELLNHEIHRLKCQEGLCLIGDHERQEYQAIAASVPPPHITELLIRYEAHFSREFERTLNQLERLQRIRRGQPVLSSIKLEL